MYTANTLIAATFITALCMGVFGLFLGTKVRHDAPPPPSTEAIQQAAAVEQFRRNLCKEDCFPGTLGLYNPTTGECGCNPPVGD